VVGKVGKAGPNCGDAVSKEVASLNAENSGPHSSDEGSKADGWVRAIHAKDGPDDDRERDVISSSHLAGERDDHRADEESEKDDWDGLTRSEAERHD
jgi:hypothetical protein